MDSPIKKEIMGRNKRIQKVIGWSIIVFAIIVFGLLANYMGRYLSHKMRSNTELTDTTTKNDTITTKN